MTGGLAATGGAPGTGGSNGGEAGTGYVLGPELVTGEQFISGVVQIEGRWYSYGNADVCLGTGIEENPCTAEACCIEYVAPSTWDSADDWSCSLGLVLNSPTTNSDIYPYYGPALGFAFVIELETESGYTDSMRVRYYQAYSEDLAVRYHRIILESGEHVIPFSEMACIGCTSDDPQFAMTGATTAVEVSVERASWSVGPGRLCITSLRPLLAPDP